MEYKVVGMISEHDLMNEPNIEIILVDHNETDQGIPGLEEIPVLEGVDHHRISFTSTPEPVAVVVVSGTDTSEVSSSSLKS